MGTKNSEKGRGLETLEDRLQNPLKGLHMDVFTLNLIGEVALGEAEEGVFTCQELAESFHGHLEAIFANRICDDAGNRSNLITVLQTNLLTLNFAGASSKSVPGYSCIGTLYVQRTEKSGNAAFSFKRHPLLVEIYSH